MILDALIPLIEAAGIAREGEDLFLHFIPATLDQAVVILPALAGTPINPQLPNYRNNDYFQVICRAGSLQPALDRAAQVTDTLTILRRTVLPAQLGRSPAVLVNYMRPRHDPVPYPRQPSGGWEVSTNFICSYVAQQGVI